MTAGANGRFSNGVRSCGICAFESKLEWEMIGIAVASRGGNGLHVIVSRAGENEEANFESYF